MNAERGQGRPATDASDILRSAVVLLHASLEDLLRSLEHDLLPRSHAPAFKNVGLPDKGAADDDPAKTTFGLGSLVQYRGSSVDDVLGVAVDFHLRHSNYNNTTQLMGVLDKYSITLDHGTRTLLTSINALMKRRHWIAHRADSNPMTGRGQPKIQPIARSSLNTWIQQVADFGDKLITSWRTWSPS